MCIDKQTHKMWKSEKMIDILYRSYRHESYRSSTLPKLDGCADYEEFFNKKIEFIDRKIKNPSFDAVRFPDSHRNNRSREGSFGLELNFFY